MTSGNNKCPARQRGRRSRIHNVAHRETLTYRRRHRRTSTLCAGNHASEFTFSARCLAGKAVTVRGRFCDSCRRTPGDENRSIVINLDRPPGRAAHGDVLPRRRHARLRRAIDAEATITCEFDCRVGYVHYLARRTRNRVSLWRSRAEKLCRDFVDSDINRFVRGIVTITEGEAKNEKIYASSVDKPEMAPAHVPVRCFLKCHG
ncbi:hypothetical protein EVAR_37675_1 [Eumeta japonica]|uniref:Uncharacterized protein n=1 Tax=Eumeta variegata TaxID=151549 RepID=A0A4C1YVU2_EUMVA|nr:hypothetical protein EVAR_37675_1 [Eumeta japonica]